MDVITPSAAEEDGRSPRDRRHRSHSVGGRTPSSRFGLSRRSRVKNLLYGILARECILLWDWFVEMGWMNLTDGELDVCDE